MVPFPQAIDRGPLAIDIDGAGDLAELLEMLGGDLPGDPFPFRADAATIVIGRSQAIEGQVHGNHGDLFCPHPGHRPLVAQPPPPFRLQHDELKPLDGK